MQAEFGIIGGTGIYDPGMLAATQGVQVETRYGTVPVVIGEYHGKRIAFLSRHGSSHSIPPHKVNYRANIMALKQLGVHQVLATAAVGSLKAQYKPGSLVVIDDFLDFTKSRPVTFFEDDVVVHVDVTDPYCARLRKALWETADKQHIAIHKTGTYVCAEGPRYESPAEIRLYQSFGAAVVGMTSVPEVVLAKEAELCYATVCMVTNFGAGLSDTPLSHQEVTVAMNKNSHLIRELFFETISNLDGSRHCHCSSATDHKLK